VTRHFCSPTSLEGLLEPDAGKLARPVLRGAGRGNASGLPGPRTPVPSRSPRRGADWTGELRKRPLMPRDRKPRWMGCCSGVQGLVAEKRKAPAEQAPQPGEHRRPRGRGGTHPSRNSCVRNVVTPVGVRPLAGKPTVRKAQSPGGNRMTKKPTPAAERQRETGTRWLALRPPSRITGRIPGLVPGRESVLTWSGEPVKKKMT